MADAALRFREYDSGRSQTFAQCVKKYRQKYGRHPPPGFDKVSFRSPRSNKVTKLTPPSLVVHLRP